LSEALVDRAWLLFAPRIPITSPLAQIADEAIIASAMRVEAQGAPAEVAADTRRFVIRWAGEANAARSALSDRGVVFTGDQLQLPEEMSTSDLLSVCDASGASVIQLLPIARALS
jgi:hypothetical protein